MRYTLGFSPCPNDTFIFDAMIHGKIDTEGIEFEVIMEDVEALNNRAAAASIHITKLSYHAFAQLANYYVLLDAGSALGNNCGPLLIAKKTMDEADIQDAKIAIPGPMTTANFLLKYAFPKAKHKIPMVFSAIEDAVLEGKADAGLIIHENRFTYAQKGLVKLADLGEIWEQRTQMPIPLGGIVALRTIPAVDLHKINRVMRRSVEYAFANPRDVMPFVRTHAQTMEDAVMQAHINLYVSHFTVNLGAIGREAVRTMFEAVHMEGIEGDVEKNIFLN